MKIKEEIKIKEEMIAEIKKEDEPVSKGDGPDQVKKEEMVVEIKREEKSVESKKGDELVEKKKKEEMAEKKKERKREERDRDKEKEREQEKQKEKEKDREKRERAKLREQERDKEKEKERQKKREREERERAKEKERTRRDERRRKDEKDRKKREEKDLKNRKHEKSPEAKKEMPNLEEEMRKRKERIEAWRNARKKGTEVVEQTDDETKEDGSKKWSLEDDDDDDEIGDGKQDTGVKKENGPLKKIQVKKEESEDEDLDPLDAFMKNISKQVNKLSGRENNSKETNKSKTKTITVVKTIVKKSVDVKIKPEVMEQNQDALEYSSEEEVAADVTAGDFDVTKKRKELTVADHTKIYYAPFKSAFYVEVPELARMTSEEVKLHRELLGDIQVRGKNVPKPIKSWSQAGMSTKVMNVLKRCQYEKPTPIQAQAMPVIMSGRDMIGIAKTGSGKTLAFVLPLLRHVVDQPPLEEQDGPIAVIMTPTRELALQIFRESKKFCKPLNLSVACIYGGSGISEQISELKKGAEVIVCTPGRMIDMLTANNGRVTNCRRCTYLVLDEADRMFDMGFEPQVRF